MDTTSGVVSSLNTKPIAARTPVLLTGGYRLPPKAVSGYSIGEYRVVNRSAAKADTVWSGVDWISATLTRDALDSQTWLYDAIHALEQVQAHGNTYKRRSLLGFDGWESGNCFVGSNDTTHYASFAGKYANDAWHYLEHPKVHVSRIDLQITVQYDVELNKEGRYQYAQAIRFNRGLPEHRRRRIDLWAGSDGSDTTYVGSPSSDVRGRIYNKAKQSNEQAYERSWRYEVVYKNDYACSVFRQLVNAGDALTDVILSEVLNWYRQRGVVVLDVRSGSGNAIAAPKQPKSDVDRKLRWIRNQVVPTIRKLAELGYAEELMEVIAEAIASARNET